MQISALLLLVLPLLDRLQLDEELLLLLLPALMNTTDANAAMCPHLDVEAAAAGGPHAHLPYLNALDALGQLQMRQQQQQQQQHNVVSRIQTQQHRYNRACTARL
jgi:hypothetical protein